MNKLTRLLLSVCLFASAAFAQNAAVSPPIKQQFFDNNGVELSGGLVFSYAGGSSTPIATFVDATATGQNTNPIVLDSSGRASIWLAPNTSYKFVVQTSAGVSLYTVDGIVVTLPNSGPWVTTGSNISNVNTGNVGVGCVSPISALDVCGASVSTNYILRLEDRTNSPGVNFVGLGGTIFGSINADTSAAFRVRAANSASQFFVVQGGVTIEDQTGTSGTTTLNLIDGASQTGGLSDAHLLSIKSNGGTELAFIDSLGEYAAPVFNGTGDTAGFTFQNNNSKFIVDTAGDITFSGLLSQAGGVIVDASSNATFNNLTINGSCTINGVTSSTACGTGGGGGGGGATGPTNSVQTNNAGTSLGYATLVFNPSTAILTIGGSGSTAASGFQGPIFSCSNTGSNNCITDAGANFLITGAGNAAFQSVALTNGWTIASSSYGITSGGVLTVASCTGCGGSGSPGAPTNSIQFNGPVGTGGAFTGDTHLTWNGSAVLVTGATTNGFQGPVFSCTNTGSNNCITDVGSNFLITAAGVAQFQSLALTSGWTAGGGSYGLTSGGALTVASCTGCGSGSSGVPSITGTANQVLVNGTSGSPVSSASTLTLPQAIGTSSAVNFGSVTSSGFITSSVSGSSTAFSVNSGGCSNCFLVDGNGNANFFGRVYANGGLVTGAWPGGPFTTRIDSSGNGTLVNLTVTGICTGCGSGGGVPSLTGTANQVLVNGTTGSPISTAATLTLPQAIGTSSNVQFGQIIGTGVINGAAASGNAFQNSAGSWAVLPNGTEGGQTAYFNSYNNGPIGSGVQRIDSAGGGHFVNMNITGTFSCTGSGCPAGGGVTGIQGSANQVLVNGTTSGFQINNVTLTLPQNIATGSAPTFAGDFINGTDAVVSLNLDYQNTGSSSAILTMRGVPVINNLTTFVGAGVDSRTSGVGATGFNFWTGSSYDNGVTHITTFTTPTGFCQLRIEGGLITGFSGAGC
jgi:hypothetical protein